jgi:serine/threonine protein kinase
VVHLDIKPENIFIDKNLDFKLGDFGFAQTKSGEDNEGNFATRYGSPGYLAPEQFNSNPNYNGQAADIFSLGVVFFLIVFGTPPFNKNLGKCQLFNRMLKNE